MDKRIRIGLRYTYNENWIGGTYYLENLIKALNTLKDNEKPEIIAIVNNHKDFFLLKKNTSYPFLKFQIHSGEKNAFYRLINRVSKKLFRKTIFSQEIKNLDAIFPYSKLKQYNLAKKKIYWIPDFQEHFIPSLFSEQEITKRRTWQEEIVYSKNNLILSSDDAYSNLKNIYPTFKVSAHIIPFAVSLPSIDEISELKINEPYNIPDEYLICCNQFWPHKNHLIILKAIKRVKENKKNVLVLFTGKTSGSYGTNPYYEKLIKFVIDNNLKENIKFLGFVDRSLQLKLLLNAKAIIQPSLFEGWSTIVEDSKALNKELIVSDIHIHKEQLKGYDTIYFSPNNEVELAESIEFILERKTTSKKEKLGYEKNVVLFAKKFIQVIKQH